MAGISCFLLSFIFLVSSIIFMVLLISFFASSLQIADVNAHIAIFIFIFFFSFFLPVFLSPGLLVFTWPWIHRVFPLSCFSHCQFASSVSSRSYLTPAHIVAYDHYLLYLSYIYYYDYSPQMLVLVILACSVLLM